MNTMITTDSNIAADTHQKWEQPFRDLLDEIWWPGYADDLLQNNPQEYSREYWYFIQLYD